MIDFPVCLYSTGTVAIGAVFTPDADDLQNHFDTPIQIDEIRFMFFVNGVSVNPLRSLAALIRVQLKMGRIDLTNGFVPAWLFGSRLQRNVETLNGVAGGGRLSAWEYHRWKLPVPMIVPAGSTLLPYFQYLLPDGTQALTSAHDSPITVHVAMVGKGSKSPSRKIKVPYVTAYIADPSSGGQQSKDDQLVNKFNTPLWVQRFVGRIAVKGGTNETWTSVEDNTGYATTGDLTVRDSNGDSVVGGVAQWFDVFSRDRKIFPAGCFLPPRDWYTVRLADKPTASYLPMISMVGWREEEMLP